MKKEYLSEAFRQLELLNEEDFNLSTTADNSDLKDFLDNDDMSVMSLDVIDPEAETEEDLEDSYTGKVILDCCVCHSKLYKDKEEVQIDEEQDLANVGEECPFCYSNDGFKVIGEVAPYGETEEETEIDESIRTGLELKEGFMGQTLDDFLGDWNNAGNISIWCYDENEDGPVFEGDVSDIPDKYLNAQFDDFDTEGKIYVNISDVDEDFDESLKTRKNRKLKESRVLKEQLIIPEPFNKYFEISTEEPTNDDYQIGDKIQGYNDTLLAYLDPIDDNLNIYPILTDNPSFPVVELVGGRLYPVDVTNLMTDDADDEDFEESLKTRRNKNESIQEIEIETDTDKIKIESEPKEESGEDILAPVSPETEQQIENNSSDEVDVPIDEFDEETFDELGESFLKNTYENVKGYKTESIKEQDGNKLVIEGLITFNSGKVKKTSFIFEAKDITKSGKVRFIGENCQLSRGKKSFTVAGKIQEGKFISESLNYNYRAKDAKSGKSTRMYGTVRTNK